MRYAERSSAARRDATNCSNPSRSSGPDTSAPPPEPEQADAGEDRPARGEDPGIDRVGRRRPVGDGGAEQVGRPLDVEAEPTGEVGELLADPGGHVDRDQGDPSV